MDDAASRAEGCEPDLRAMEARDDDLALLSATPDKFEEFVEAAGLMMKTEPNYAASD